MMEYGVARSETSLQITSTPLERATAITALRLPISKPTTDMKIKKLPEPSCPCFGFKFNLFQRFLHS